MTELETSKLYEALDIKSIMNHIQAQGSLSELLTYDISRIRATLFDASQHLDYIRATLEQLTEQRDRVTLHQSQAEKIYRTLHDSLKKELTK